MKCRRLSRKDGEWHADQVHNLYLRVQPKSKSWVVRLRHLGRTKVVTLGKFPRLSLADARIKAAELATAPGINDATVDELLDRFLVVIEREHKRPEFMHVYARRAIRPGLGFRKVRDLTTADCAELVSDYAKRSGPRAGDALRSMLKSMLAFATELGMRQDNPAAALSRRVSGYRQVDRTRTLTPDEIRLLWSEESPNARVLRFQLATALRIGEAQKGHQEGERWVVPARISKNGREHWVHLSGVALEQLPLPRCTATNIQAWLRRWCVRHGVEPRFTPHDCRRTASTLMNEAGVEPFVVERVLNHTLPGVMGVYNRAEYEAARVEAMLVLERELQ